MSPMSIEIEGFEASRDLMSFLDKQLLWIEEQAPFISFIKIKIEKIDAKYKCILEINSEKNKFSSETEGEHVTHVAIDAIEKMEKTLKYWKLTRNAAAQA